MGRSGVERGNTHHSNRGRVCCPPVGCSEVSSLSPINSHHSTFIHHHSNFWVGRCVVGGLSAGVGRNAHHSNQRNAHHSNLRCAAAEN